MQELSKRKSFEIIWKPILVGGIFNTINPSVYESRQNPIKEKLVYSQKDLDDWSKSRGLDIRNNQGKLLALISTGHNPSILLGVEK